MSIATQFFLGVTNIYCASHGFSTANFGRIFDDSPDLSAELAASVMTALQQGLSIEDTLLDCVNAHRYTFQLRAALSPRSMDTIKTKFTGFWDIRGW